MSTATQPTLNLVKGQKVDMTKTNPGLKAFAFGLGWDLQPGVTFDLDAFAFLVNGAGKECAHPVFFGHLSEQGVKHSGDNLTGAGDGDDEVITIEQGALPADCEKVVIGVNIYDAKAGQNFGQVKGAFCRAFDPAVPDQSIIKYDLNEDYSTNTAVIMGEFYKKDGEWKFNALGEGKAGDINSLRQAYL